MVKFVLCEDNWYEPFGEILVAKFPYLVQAIEKWICNAGLK